MTENELLLHILSPLFWALLLLPGTDSMLLFGNRLDANWGESKRIGCLEVVENYLQ